MVRPWVSTGAIPCITRACHPLNMKRSPPVLDSTFSNTLRMMRGREGERCGSVNAMTWCNVALWPLADIEMASREKRTSQTRAPVSASDPERTSPSRLPHG
jgi:hypothetical protein